MPPPAVPPGPSAGQWVSPAGQPGASQSAHLPDEQATGSGQGPGKPMWPWILGGCAAGAALVLGGFLLLGGSSSEGPQTAAAPAESAAASASAEPSEGAEQSAEASTSAELGGESDGEPADGGSGAGSAVFTIPEDPGPRLSNPDEFVEMGPFATLAGVDDYRAVIADDGRTILYDFVEGKAIWELPEGLGWPQVDVDAGVLLTSDESGIRSFDLVTGEELGSLPPEDGSVPLLCGSKVLTGRSGETGLMVEARGLGDGQPYSGRVLFPSEFLEDCWETDEGLAIGWMEPLALSTVADGVGTSAHALLGRGLNLPLDADGAMISGPLQGKHVSWATTWDDRLVLGLGPAGAADATVVVTDRSGQPLGDAIPVGGYLGRFVDGKVMVSGDSGQISVLDLSTGTFHPMDFAPAHSATLDRWGHACTLGDLELYEGGPTENSGSLACYQLDVPEYPLWSLEVTNGSAKNIDGYWLVTEGGKTRIFR